MTVKDFEIQSTSTKSDTSVALRITTQHLQRPGPTVSGMSIKGIVSGEEWGYGWHFHDCSGITFFDADFQGYSYNLPNARSIPVWVTNSAGKSSVEHNFFGFNFRNVHKGFSFESEMTGGKGIEGIQLAMGTVAGCVQGIYARSVNSPQIGISGVHINAFGGEALYIDGYQQVSVINSDSYVNKSTNGTWPARGVYFKNLIGADGDLRVNLLGDNTNTVTDYVPWTVELDGSYGGDIDFNIKASVYAEGSSILKVNPAVNGGVTAGISYNWSGNLGPVTGVLINSDGAPYVKRKFISAIDAVSPSFGMTNQLTVGEPFDPQKMRP